MYGLRNQRAPGMQIHAVPEVERAVDNNGRKLPWGYDYASLAAGENAERQPAEKGPFGRSMRRSRSGASRSRSKTAEPRREEDRIKMENMAAEDAVFGSLRRAGTKEGSGDGKREMMSDGDRDAANVPKEVSKLAPTAANEGDSEPSEVILYGFGEGLQWAAIDFYERVSNGVVLEDYDRQPPGQRYDVSRSLGRATAQRSLSRAAMRKKNKFAGGAHWIKITFDSRQASELALARQPHTIKGYLVYAAPYQERGPQRDEAVLATQAGAQITSEALPVTFATGDVNGSPNTSDTISSATATAPSIQQGRAPPPWNAPLGGGIEDSPTASSATMTRGVSGASVSQTPAATGFQQTSGAALQLRRLRIEGATRIVPLPAELALAPKQPKASWTSWIGANEIIGSAVPRKEDGSFDWDRASLYWRLFWWLDTLLGTDFCGLRGDD